MKASMFTEAQIAFVLKQAEDVVAVAEVYLHAWETGSQAKAGIGRWMTFYNHQRSHAAHGGQTPAVVYWNQIQPGQQTRKVA